MAEPNMAYQRKGRFALRFADPEEEAAYRRFSLEHNTRQAVVALVIYAAFKAAFGVVDVLVQTPDQLGEVLVQRFGIVAISLVAMALLPRVTKPRQYDLLMFAWALLVVAGTFHTVAHRPPNNMAFTTTSPILILLFFSFFRNRFELQLTSSLLLIALDVFAFFHLRDPQPLPVMVHVCAIYLLALTVGIVVSRQIKQSSRSYYALFKRERALGDAMKELAYRDELTGVLNRRSFLMQAGAHWRPTTPGRANDCLLMLDLDNFKHLNDAYGHAVGDRALVRFARLAESLKRKDDIFGRIGGEEFALLLPETSREQAEAVAERILSGCRSLPIVDEGDESLSVSVGIAEVDGDDLDLASTMRRADRALYNAKARGRGRSVSSWEPEQNG